VLNLKGKRALVTGASRGAGFGIAKAFAAAGAEIVATARNHDRLEKLRREIEADGGKATTIPGDLSTRAGARGVAKQCGDVDILVNNAGVAVGKWQRFLEQDDASWDYEFGLNVIGPVTLMQELVPGMIRRGQGRIINISSVAAARPTPDRAPYSASKAALEAASKSAAIDLGPQGIRVNVVALGITKTEALDETLGGGMTVEEVGRKFTPIGHVATVPEVAATCLFLASDVADSINGIVLTIDGGSTAGNFDPNNSYFEIVPAELKV